MAKFEIYRDPAGDFCRRFQSYNGRILAVSAEGYITRANCEHAILLIKQQAPQAAITDTVASLSSARSGMMGAAANAPPAGPTSIKKCA